MSDEREQPNLRQKMNQAFREGDPKKAYFAMLEEYEVQEEEWEARWEKVSKEREAELSEEQDKVPEEYYESDESRPSPADPDLLEFESESIETRHQVGSSQISSGIPLNFIPEAERLID